MQLPTESTSARSSTGLRSPQQNTDPMDASPHTQNLYKTSLALNLSWNWSSPLASFNLNSSQVKMYLSHQFHVRSPTVISTPEVITTEIRQYLTGKRVSKQRRANSLTLGHSLPTKSQVLQKLYRFKHAIEGWTSDRNSSFQMQVCGK